MSVEYQKYKELNQNDFEKKHRDINSFTEISISEIEFENEINIESSIFHNIKYIQWKIKKSNIPLTDYPLYNDIKLDILIFELNGFKQEKSLFITRKVFLISLEKITFKDCIFNKAINIIDRNINRIKFINCVFKEDIYKLIKKKYSNHQKLIFDDCKIFHFKLWNISTDYPLQEFELIGGEIEYLEILNKKIKKKFYLNKQYDGNKKLTKITNLIIKNTTFKKNFKLHNCVVDNILIADVDFEKNADFFKSTFKRSYPKENKDRNIYMKAINFRKLALFGDCTFHEKIFLQYVTFEGYSHFRRTKFKKGLDLDYTNIQEEMNFFNVEQLDSKESIENTSQETYRIIKHNFEKIANKVEANKYHALELEKKLEDDNSPFSERFILWFHWFFSRNGTSWILPFLFIFLVGFTTVLFIHLDSLNIQDFGDWKLWEKGLTESFKYIYILYKDNALWNNHPIIFALNKFSLGYLYYQFLIAVRKDTRK